MLIFFPNSLLAKCLVHAFKLVNRLQLIQRGEKDGKREKEFHACSPCFRYH